jgi:hypothetical protein
MSKYALVVFNGDPMCFIHVLLNALDMKERGHEAKIVMAGAATKLIPDLYVEGNPLHGLWKKCLAADAVAGVCLACATKLGVREATEAHGLRWMGEMAGHPSLAALRADGYEVITF